MPEDPPGFDEPFDLRAVLEALARNGVDFVLIGGLAGTAWGSAYPTYDIDVAYARDRANLERMLATLLELGAKLRAGRESNDVAAELPFVLDLRTLENGMNLTFRTDAGSLDVLGEPAGISSYEDLRASAASMEIEGVAVRVASIDHLIAMKRAAGRVKDKLMLEEYKVIADELHRRGER